MLRAARSCRGFNERVVLNRATLLFSTPPMWSDITRLLVATTFSTAAQSASRSFGSYRTIRSLLGLVARPLHQILAILLGLGALFAFATDFLQFLVGQMFDADK